MNKKFVVLVLSMLLIVGCSSNVVENNVTPENIVVEDSAVKSNDDDLFGNYIALGEYDASIMIVGLPSDYQKHMEQITNKFRASVEMHKEWLAEYISQYPEQVLPWHENFGVTVDEYNEILNLTDKMEFVENGKTSVVIRKLDDGTINFSGNKGLEFLTKVDFDVKRNEIAVGDYTMTYSGQIVASEDQKVTGQWNGNTWTVYFEEVPSSLELENDKMYGQISLSIGKLTDSDNGIILYKKNIFKNGIRYNGEEILVLN